MIITCPDIVTRRAIVDSIIDMLTLSREHVAYFPEIDIVQGDKLTITLMDGDQRSFIDPVELRMMIENHMAF